MPVDIQPIHWDAIIDSIRTESCIPFLGAGVNVSSKSDEYEYKGLPLANEVALRLVRPLTKLDYGQLEKLTIKAAEDIRLRIAQVTGGLNEEEMRNLTEEAIKQHLQDSGLLPNLLRATLPDLSRVALEVQMGAGFPYLLRKLREILPDISVEPSPMLEALAKLRKTTPNNNGAPAPSPFKLIVTTNYDSLLERAFGNNGLDYLPVIQYTDRVEIENGKEKDQDKALSQPKGTIIYKLHGTFSDTSNTQENKRLILTEEDYIEFLSNLGDPFKGVPKSISSKLKMDSTILFLGYGLQDWDFRTIYKTMIESIEGILRPQSFAIQKNPPDYLVKYWTLKGVTILNVDLYEFAKELQARWNQISSTQ